MNVIEFLKAYGLWEHVQERLILNFPSDTVDGIYFFAEKTKFKWGRGSTLLGLYSSRKNTLSVSRHLEDTERFRDTTLHEFAHLMVGYYRKYLGMEKETSHGPTWKRFAHAIGAAPRANRPLKLEERKKVIGHLPVRAVCQKCNFEWRKKQRLRFGYTYKHVKCGGIFKPTI